MFAGLYSQEDTPSVVSRGISIGKYPPGNATIVCMFVQCTVLAWIDKLRDDCNCTGAKIDHLHALHLEDPPMIEHHSARSTWRGIKELAS